MAELGAKQDVIDTGLDQVRVEMRTELEKLSGMVAGLAEQSAQRFGQVDQSLRSHAEVTHALSQSAQAFSRGDGLAQRLRRLRQGVSDFGVTAQ